MMMNTYRRRWQRFILLVIVAVIIVLLWPFMNTPAIRQFWSSARFQIPKPPEITAEFSTMPNDLQYPKTWVMVIDSKDPTLLSHLQQQGWPAYLEHNMIHVGPYLESFKAQTDLTKIRQITTIAVKIETEKFI